MYASQTGGGPPVVEVLEKVENEILDLMTPIAIQGLPSIKESSTHFNFDTDFYDLSSFDINNDEDIPNQNPRLDTNIGDIHMEQEIQDHSVVNDIQFDEVIIDQENTVHPSTGTGNKTGNDHSYSLEFPGPKEKGIIPKKRLTKTRRLTSSLQVGQKAANSMDRRTEMFESYYEEKKNYLKHRKNYEMKKLNLLRINKNTNLQILETLKSMHKCNCSK
ncbi:unnamed protein product [Ceutorhynchus assimilis]|uniref:Uncharacterized protein n=1 Tax=Ceutorhynchus assimilis TaxID=467358 RepID=A0A9N9MIZ7_9CUCU|nr:unnamed protein product [Ceutorhynchus assimilis]